MSISCSFYFCSVCILKIYLWKLPRGFFGSEKSCWTSHKTKTLNRKKEGLWFSAEIYFLNLLENFFFWENLVSEFTCVEDRVRDWRFSRPLLRVATQLSDSTLCAFSGHSLISASLDIHHTNVFAFLLFFFSAWLKVWGDGENASGDYFTLRLATVVCVHPVPRDLCFLSLLFYSLHVHLPSSTRGKKHPLRENPPCPEGSEPLPSPKCKRGGKSTPAPNTSVHPSRHWRRLGALP